MIDIQDSKVNDVLEIKVLEKLTNADFEHAEPVIEKHISESANPKLLLIMQEFSGWNDASAFWKDLKMDTEYIGEFDRIALVGDEEWEEWSAKLTNPVTSAEIEFFNLAEITDARKWLS